MANFFFSVSKNANTGGLEIAVRRTGSPVIIYYDKNFSDFPGYACVDSEANNCDENDEGCFLDATNAKLFFDNFNNTAVNVIITYVKTQDNNDENEEKRKRKRNKRREKGGK